MGFSFQRATAAMTHVAGHMLLDKENTASDVWADTAYRPGDDDCYTFAQTLAASAAAISFFRPDNKGARSAQVCCLLAASKGGSSSGKSISASRSAADSSRAPRQDCAVCPSG
jgi:hypothetical protein